ncbi:hypothetical protein ACYCEU_08425 [Actinotignum timonense]|uniref:hypothetical protein n=1 Tax=Actinotignum TaxID=1653174 RepID=UPI000408AED1|nr:hypothetical protein [Actinotignum schaalii]AIE83046.1 hypothetical protein FB03_07040 [Actinotignum schaalii]WQN45202.1 hypothetical protein U4A90_00455 [Actinotignum schaalii]
MLWQNILAILSVLAGPLLYLTGAVVIAVVGIALARFLGALTRLANARAEKLERAERTERAEKLERPQKLECTKHTQNPVHTENPELQDPGLSSSPDAP